MKFKWKLLLTCLIGSVAANGATVIAVPAKPSDSIETLINYGVSVQGRKLVAVVLGDGSNVTLVLGGIHGNELSAPGVVEQLKDYLESHPKALDGNTVVLVSHVNPDGDAMGTRGNADRVDLNRNFPVGWAPKRPGISLSPGARPLSEPESAALVKLLILIKPSKIVSIHQPFDCLLPSGPGGAVLARTMSLANGYKISNDVGYPTPGSFGSYCYRAKRIASVTLEMPEVNVSRAWLQNQEALLAAIQLDPAEVAE